MLTGRVYWVKIYYSLAYSRHSDRREWLSPAFSLFFLAFFTLAGPLLSECVEQANWPVLNWLTIWNCQIILFIPFWFSSPSSEEPMETSSASQVIIIITVILLLLIITIIIIIIIMVIITTATTTIIIIITIIVVCSITKNKCTLYYSHLLKVLDIPVEHKLNLKLKRIEYYVLIGGIILA